LYIVYAYGELIKVFFLLGVFKSCISNARFLSCAVLDILYL
jgi:hypothetical protein